MNLKTVRKLSDVLYMLTIGLFGLMLILPAEYRTWMIAAVIVSLLFQLVFSMRFMVCPYCGHNVGRYDDICPHCKRSLNTDRKVRKKKKD